jgi:hypothetical protein
MSKEIRSTIFLFFFAIFLILGPAVVLWSQGYRFDFSQKDITRVGAVFLKTTPSQTLIKITPLKPLRKGEEPKSIVKKIEPTLLYSGVLVKNLLPRTYNVKIEKLDVKGVPDQKSSYFSWEKELAVKPLGVQRASHVVLFSKEIQPTEIPSATGIVAIWSKPENDGVLFQNLTSPNLFELAFGNKGDRPELLFNPRPLAGKNKIKEILFSSNNRNLILTFGNDAILWLPEKTVPAATDTQAVKPQPRLASKYLNLLVKNAGAGVKSFKYYWHPTDANQFFVVISDKSLPAIRQGFYRVDVVRDEFQRISKSRILGFGVEETDSFFLTVEGDLFRINANNEPAFVLAVKKGLEELQTSFWEIRKIPEGKFIFINKEKDTVYMLEKDFLLKIQSVEKDALISKLKIAASPDKTRLAFLKGNELWLYFLSSMNDDFSIEKNLAILLKTFAKPPQNIFWLSDNWHLLAVFESGIEIIETDFRSGAQSWKPSIGLVRTGLDQPSFNIEENTLWAVDNQILKSWRIR